MNKYSNIISIHSISYNISILNALFNDVTACTLAYFKINSYKLGEVVIAHKDRLSRSAFDIIQYIIEKPG